jgi:predicted RNA methylase
MAMYCTLVRRSHGLEALTAAALAHTHGAELAEPGVYLSDRPLAWAETAFGVAGGRQLAAASTLADLSAQLRALDLRPPSFGIVAYRIPQVAKGSTAAKRAVADAIDGDRVDTAAPALPLGLLISPRGWRVFVRAAGGDAAWVRAEQRPHTLPVSLGVRTAKAMVELSVSGPGPAVVLDPFAGSGTIALVAALSGHVAIGSDIARRTLQFARANAAALGVPVAWSVQDARTTEQRADCVVTNLPYGTFSHLPERGMDAVLANLKRLAPRVTLVSSEDLGAALLAHGYTVDAVIPVEPQRFRRFVYVTRS